MIGRFVILRTSGAGVHCGWLKQVHSSSQGTTAELANARRIWRWRGANSLHELSLRGASQAWTRISEPVPEIFLSQVIEIIPCTAEAEANLTQSRWAKE